jgi:hypothetical protein
MLDRPEPAHRCRPLVGFLERPVWRMERGPIRLVAPDPFPAVRESADPRRVRVGAHILLSGPLLPESRSVLLGRIASQSRRSAYPAGQRRSAREVLRAPAAHEPEHWRPSCWATRPQPTCSRRTERDRSVASGFQSPIDLRQNSSRVERPPPNKALQLTSAGGGVLGLRRPKLASLAGRLRSLAAEPRGLPFRSAALAAERPIR